MKMVQRRKRKRKTDRERSGVYIYFPLATADGRLRAGPIGDGEGV